MILTVTSSRDAEMSTPEPGLRRQIMSYNQRLMLVRHKLQKGWIGTRHQHPHEQMVYVVTGHLLFEHPEGRFELRTGDSFIVPGGTDHQASALEDSEVLDIFAPYREEYCPEPEGA